MENKKPGVDVINEVLESCILAYPVSSFIISLYKQYTSRGWLTKKQMQGLHDKASRVPDIPPGKLASLQATINKMPTRYRTEAPKTTAPIFQKDEEAGELIRQILSKFPEHKRVLFLQSKYENHEKLNPADMADLKRFAEVVKKRR